MASKSKAITYTDEQFFKDYPEKLKKCGTCKKPFTTRHDAKYCSDKCFKKKVDYNRRYFKKNYVKSGRNLQP